MDTFSTIDDTSDAWSFHAKVLRKWVVRRKAAPHPVWKVGMILVDKDLTQVEVAATQKQVLPRFQEEPQENIVYNFENFELEKNVDQYIVTSHPWMLKFHSHTLCKDSDIDFSTETSSLIPIE